MENYAYKEVDQYGTVSYVNSKGQYHRLDGPACEWVNGDKVWWVNDKIHRLDGPAIVYSNGYNEWWINHKGYLKPKHNRLALFFTLEPSRIDLRPI